MVVLSQIVGRADDPGISQRLRDLGHAGHVEYITLDRDDARRHRLRAFTDRGTECAIVLERQTRLVDGAVLQLNADRAIVVRISEREWLAIEPRDIGAALELGYQAGNGHWTVRFSGPLMMIALERPAQEYLDRLARYMADGRAKRVDDGR